MEQKNLESMLKSTHTMKVLQFYNQENEKSRKIIEMSNELLQESYFVLNGNMLMTEAMRDQFGQLYKVHDQRGVKFTESDEIFEISENHSQADFLFDADHLMVKAEDSTGGGRSSSAFKRQRGADECDVCPTKKRVVRSIFDGPNLDTTHVLASHHPSDLNAVADIDDGSNMNATFAIKPITIESGGSNKVTAMKALAPSTRALKENNPNIHKGFAVPKVVTKPMAKVKSTFIHGAQHQQKENKRTPSKSIRRSPRSVSVDPFNRSMYRFDFTRTQTTTIWIFIK